MSELDDFVPYIKNGIRYGFMKKYSDGHIIVLWALKWNGVYSNPDEDNLEINDYTHFGFSMSKDKDENVIYLDDVIQKFGGFPGEKYNSISYQLVPKDKIIEGVKKINSILGSNSTVSSSNGGVCFKCKQFDGYASPSPKHNNKIVCYRCF